MPAFEDVAPRPDPRTLLPQSLEAEQAVLGTILLQPDAILQVVEIPVSYGFSANPVASSSRSQ